jgi:F420-dependent oxidoreductase-like protein
MRIGIFASDANLSTLVEKAAEAEADGFDSFWLPQIFGVDALSAHTLIGTTVPRIELGTAVVPTYPRHPLTLAGQALTASAASGGRLTLGIGLSHQLVVENMWGYSFDKPVRHMREYLTALVPLCAGESVSFTGETVTANGGIMIEGAAPVPVLVAALGPAMLKLAAERTGGTITWMTGPKTLREHTVPRIGEAAAKAGRPAPRVIAGLPIAVTEDVAAAREVAGRAFQVYGFLPSYRAMLDREGAEGPADVAVTGDESAVGEQLQRLKEAGVTDFMAAIFPVGKDPADSVARTRKTLVDLLTRF